MSSILVKKVITSLALVVTVMALLSCNKKSSSVNHSDGAPSKAAFAKYIKTLQKPAMVDFGSTSCVPCKMMVPVLEELKVKYSNDLETIFVHVNEDPEKVKEFSIKTIPTQIFFDTKGKEISRHVGFISTADILATFASNGIIIKK